MPETLTTTRDIPLIITSTASSSERRITPSWSIAHLKSKLEPITGIPPSSQELSLRLPDHQQQSQIAITTQDEEATHIGAWPLVAYAEIHVTSTTPNLHTLPPASSVPKYEMPTSTYETLPSSVLAFKKSHKIGRFDPATPQIQAQKVRDGWGFVGARAINPSARCRINTQDTRRGTVRYVGPIPELPGLADLPWVGVELDEPVGKNDGRVGGGWEGAGGEGRGSKAQGVGGEGVGGESVGVEGSGGEKGTRYFKCGPKRGVFVRPERVEVGDFAVLGLDDEVEEDEDMEEI